MLKDILFFAVLDCNSTYILYIVGLVYGEFMRPAFVGRFFGSEISNKIVVKIAKFCYDLQE